MAPPCQTAAKVRSGLRATASTAAVADSGDGAMNEPSLFLTEAKVRPEALAVE